MAWFSRSTETPRSRVEEPPKPTSETVVLPQLRLLDTTLREGLQAPGNYLSPAQRLSVARELEQLGVDVIEVGFPISSPSDFKSVAEIAKSVDRVEVCALSRCLEADIREAAAAVSPASRPLLHLFIATSPLHREKKLGLSPREVLGHVRSSVRVARSLGIQVMFSAEDATRTEIEFLADVLLAAAEEGARTVNIVDTVGMCLPHQMQSLVADLRSVLPEECIFSCHCHNDLGLAAANALAAIAGGAGEIQVTVNGIGDRAGITALEDVVLALECHGESLGAAHCIALDRLSSVCELVWRELGRSPSLEKTLTGRNYFLHEAGIHQDGIGKDVNTYHPLDPGLMSRKASMVFGPYSGKTIVKRWMDRNGVPTDRCEELVKMLKSEVEGSGDTYFDCERAEIFLEATVNNQR